MKEAIDARFQELISEGHALTPALDAGDGFAPQDQIEKYQGWMFSSINLLRTILSDNSPYMREAATLVHDANPHTRISGLRIRKLLGLLKSAKEEWDHGLLKKIEYIVAASTFDDFLDHADDCHKRSQKEAYGALGRGVFEDTLRKIGTKNSVDSKQDVEQIIHGLVKQDIFTDVKAKRIQVASGLRNKALHSKWDEYDLSDVGTSIKIVRDMIDEYL